MGCALLSMLKTRTLVSLIWTALSFPSVNGSFITNNAGNCSSNEFWYEPIRDCVPLGKPSLEDVPPYGTACPSVERDWYWSSRLSVCLPTTPLTDVPSSVSCPTHYTWDAMASRCIQAKQSTRRSAACGRTEFWFSERAICIPRRDLTAPSTIRCPRRWYWSAQLTSCVPANPGALSSPTCGAELVWSPSTLMCQRAVSRSRRSPSSTPSQRPSPSPSPSSRRHNLKLRTVSLCRAGLDACPILRAGDLSDYECIDPKYDLQHCGGCSVDGRGEDCTAIEGVWNVECIHARCSILTCMAGYVPSTDQKTCVKL